MIFHQKDSTGTWFSWDTVTMKHYYPKTYGLLGPNKWNMEYNLKNGTSILGPNTIGDWND